MNKFKYILPVAVLTTTLVSCLKDKGIEDQKYGMINLDVNRIIEIPNEDHQQILGIDFKDLDTTIAYVPVRLAANDVAPEDIKVQLNIAGSDDAIEAYNDENGTEVEVFPTSLYSFPNGLTITIPKGSRVGYLKIKTNAINFNPSSVYGLDFRVENVTPANYVISQNFRSLLAIIQAKNKYDGVYTVVSGTVTRYTNPTTVENPSTLNGSLVGNPNATLATVGPNTVEISGLQWKNGSNSGVGGIPGLRATVDPATNKVSMASVGDASGPANTTLTNKPGADNYYDPATKTFYLNFHWNPAANKREYEVVLKYKRAR